MRGHEPSKPKDSPEVLARIEECLPLVESLARQTRRQCGFHVQLDDLLSHGREALLRAARSYDPDKGVPFRSWAALRIRGGLIDGLRRHGDLPKRVYRQLRAVEAADRVHEGALEENAGATTAHAGNAGGAAGASAADAQLDGQLASAAMAMAMSFLAQRNADATELAADPDRSPESTVGHAELLDRIRSAIAERPEQERALLTRHYFDDVTFEDAAKELGLSKSWACRLHLRALEAVAKSLKRSRVGS